MTPSMTVEMAAFVILSNPFSSFLLFLLHYAYVCSCGENQPMTGMKIPTPKATFLTVLHVVS